MQGSSNRNQSLRLLMLLIIIGTFPFYCFGIYLIGSAPVEMAAVRATATAADVPSFTPLGADLFPAPTATARPAVIASNTPLSGLQPTPVQYVPPTPIPADTIVAQTIVSPSPIFTPESPTPAVRAPTIADADFDGVPDAADKCVDQGGYVDSEGCPFPDDPDLDGIRGDADTCPNEYAPDTPRGCRDFDDDGLDTAEDECPQEAGPISNRGCPLDGG